MDKIKKIVADSVLSHPGKILLVLTAIVILSVSVLPGLKSDPNPWLLAESHPARVSLSTLRANYTGAGESIFILLESEDTIFNFSTLKRIKRLTDAFEHITLADESDYTKLKDIAASLNGEPFRLITSLLEKNSEDDPLEIIGELEDSMKNTGQWTDHASQLLTEFASALSPVAKVTSLSNTDNITASSDGVEISHIYDAIPETKTGLEVMRQKVTGNKLFKDILFTDDLKYTSIVIEQALRDSDSKNQYRLYERIKQILKREIPGPESHYIAGMPVASATLGHTIEVDSSRLFPVVLSLVVICLLLSFRMFMGVAAPVLVVIFSLVITLALKVVCNVPINVITTALPVFILSIGVADGIHIFSEYRDNLIKGLDKKDAVRQTILELATPVIMTSLTTAAAFWALSITRIVKLQHFGIFVAAGTLIAMVFSLVFIPALILVLPGMSERKKNKKNPVIDRYVTGFLKSISRFSLNRPYVVLISAVTVVLISAYGTSRVRVDNNDVDYQLADSPFVIATKKINSKAAGSSILNILIHSSIPGDDPLTDPENLLAVEALNDFIKSKPEVGKVTGFTELIKRINYVLHEENPAFDRIPELVEHTFDGREISGKHLVSQLLLLYENGGGDTLSDVVLGNYSEINLKVVMKVNSSRLIKGVIDDISSYAETVLPEGLSIRYSGSANTMVAATSEIVTGQILSLCLSFSIIFVMLIYTFRSLSMGIIAMLPLVTTLLINFGIMGFFSIPLDIGTAVISSIVIGIGVDYSIHYLKRVKEYSDKGHGFEDAVLRAVRQSGKAILYNAITVGIGFTAMLFSILTPLITMGWMITVTMFVSALSTIVLLPAVLSVVSDLKTNEVQPGKPSEPVYT